jgi:hypothetical protein
MLYNGATALSQQYFGYSALNASSVVDYAAFSNGKLIQCNGPVNVYSGGMYTITLGGVEQAYGLSAAQLGTGLGGLALGITSMLTTPSTSLTIMQTTLEMGGVTNGTNLYISVINTSKVYGLPAFGFILNATNYYGNPTSSTCNYGKITQIG